MQSSEDGPRSPKLRLRYHLLLLMTLVAGGWVSAATLEHSPGQPEELDEVVVQGRVPGPPLWKISKGDHVLWILPLVDIYPKHIDIDSERIESLMAGSQEYLYRPRNGVEIAAVATGPLAKLRALSAYNKIKRLARGQKLSDLLTPELYARLQALQSRYFRFTRISDLTVWEVRRLLEDKALDHERLAMVDYSQLTSPLVITRKLLRWLNRNDLDRRTNTSYFEKVTIEPGEIKEAAEVMVNLAVSEDVMRWEIGCLEKTVAYFERDFAGAKRRANAWAKGYANDLLSPTRLYTESDPCRSLPLELAAKGHPDLEQFLQDNPGLAPDYAVLDRKRRERWLANAERALAENSRTFGVLTVNDILEKDSLIATMAARGYKVEAVAR